MDQGKSTSSTVAVLFPALLILDVSGASLAGVPVSLGILALLLLLLIVPGGRRLCPPSWLHVAFLAAFCLGLIPLERPHLSAGVRELVQCVAVLGLAWVLFASADAKERRPAVISLAILCPVLMVWGAAARFTGLSTPFSDARLALVVCVSFPFLISALLGHKWKLIAVAVAFALLVLGSRNGGLLLCGLLGGITCVLLEEKKYALRVLLAGALPAVIAGIIAGGSTWQTLAPRNADTGNLKRLFVEYEATPAAIAAAPMTGHGLGRYKDVILGHFVRFVDPDDNRIVADTNSTYSLLAVEAGLPAALLLIVLIAGTALRAVLRARENIEAAPAAGAAIALLFAGLFTTILTRNTGITAAFALGAATAVVPRPEKASLLAWAARAGIVVAAAAACLAVGLLPGRAEEPGGNGLIIIDTAYDDEPEYWVIEAERPVTAPDGTMTITAANDASGNAVLAIPQDAGPRAREAPSTESATSPQAPAQCGCGPTGKTAARTRPAPSSAISTWSSPTASSTSGTGWHHRSRSTHPAKPSSCA